MRSLSARAICCKRILGVTFAVKFNLFSISNEEDRALYNIPEVLSTNIYCVPGKSPQMAAPMATATVRAVRGGKRLIPTRAALVLVCIQPVFVIKFVMHANYPNSQHYLLPNLTCLCFCL